MSLGTVWLGSKALGSKSLGSLGTRGVGAALLACLVLTGCPSPSATLVIVSPEDGAVLGVATDTNPALAGVQTDIIVEATGIAVGDNVELIVDDVIVTSQLTPEDGQFTFEDITLSPGEHVIRASRSGTVESAPITVTVTSDECFAISFVTPNPAGSRITLGPADDTDGMACGATFETTVVVSTAAPNGSNARLLVNGAPLATTSVAAGVARFEGVAFDRRAPMENTLAVEITNADSVTCSQNFPVPIVVDCAGASCTITSPDAGGGFLNQDDDVSDEVGFQGDFEVTTDGEGAGQPVRLIIDGNETDALSALPDGTVASFGNVGLSEGVHRVQAECTDAAGNTTRSGAAEWTVDVTPCPVTLGAPTEGTVFIDSDDLDTSTSGIDIDVSGTCGGDCTDTRVGLCSALDGLAFEPATPNYTKRVELGSSPTQSLCAEARDAAGNVSRVMVGVRVVTAAPQLQIATPTAGASFNRASDANLATPACDTSFEVYCTALGGDVELVRESAPTLVMATAPCVADATVPSPYMGLATFSSVPLPSLESWAPYNVVARQTADRLTGSSAPVSLQADCVAPNLIVDRPTCGATLLASMDENTATPDFEYRTNIAYSNGRVGDSLTLTIQPAGGGAATFTETRAFATSPMQFNTASYGAGGELQIIATATDAAGNPGTSAPCSVTVQDLPRVTITSPAAGAVLGSASDCNAGAPGLQVRVQGTTDAAPGSTISVEVGTETTTGTVGAGGVIDICASAVDGRSIVLRTRVTDARGTGVASLTLTIDSMAPPTAIGDLMASVVDARGGIVRFDWTAVADAGGLVLSSYALRCAAAPIATEDAWAAAMPMTVTRVPASSGTMQSDDVGGFRVGQSRHCVLRGADPTGALTPLPTAGADVIIDFGQQTVALAGSSRLGDAIAPVGDVNGDGIDDVLIAGLNFAYLYLGSASGLATSPAVTIDGTGAGGFGRSLAGLGDVNGDGLADFAVGARAFLTGATRTGAVFVFFGRPATMTWPATIVIDTVGAGGERTCGGVTGTTATQRYACFYGAADVGFFGWGLGSAGDFDGDGLMDIGIGAPSTNSNAGRIYVVLGDAALVAGSSFELGAPGIGPDGFVMDGDATLPSFGSVIASVGGDTDGDGRGDIMILSTGRTSPTVPAAVSYLSGRAHTGTGIVSLLPSALSTIGTGPANAYGNQLSAAGDVNRDGFLDIAVHNSTGASSVTLYLGNPTGGFVGATTITISNDVASGSSDRFGMTLGSGRTPWLGTIGDVDGDRYTDVLTGSLERGALPGTAEFFYRTGGTTPGLRSQAELSVGPATSSAVTAATSDGMKVAFIGDVNGDGAPDMATADPAFGGGAGHMVIHY